MNVTDCMHVRYSALSVVLHLTPSDLPGATTPTVAQKSDTSAKLNFAYRGHPHSLPFTEPKVMEKKNGALRIHTWTNI